MVEHLLLLCRAMGLIPNPASLPKMEREGNLKGRYRMPNFILQIIAVSRELDKCAPPQGSGVSSRLVHL